ncbi:Uncharacterised protein [Actinobacillus equuli]|nr:Uncharacterised protein [Actinobacillus equuli]
MEWTTIITLAGSFFFFLLLVYQFRLLLVYLHF